MKKLIYLLILAVAIVAFSCKKEGKQGVDDSLPHDNDAFFRVKSIKVTDSDSPKDYRILSFSYDAAGRISMVSTESFVDGEEGGQSLSLQWAGSTVTVDDVPYTLRKGAGGRYMIDHSGMTQYTYLEGDRLTETVSEGVSEFLSWNPEGSVASYTNVYPEGRDELVFSYAKDGNTNPFALIGVDPLFVLLTMDVDYPSFGQIAIGLAGNTTVRMPKECNIIGYDSNGDEVASWTNTFTYSDYKGGFPCVIKMASGERVMTAKITYEGDMNNVPEVVPLPPFEGDISAQINLLLGSYGTAVMGGRGVYLEFANAYAYSEDYRAADNFEGYEVYLWVPDEGLYSDETSEDLLLDLPEGEYVYGGAVKDFKKYGPGISNVAGIIAWRGSENEEVTDCSVKVENVPEGKAISVSGTSPKFGEFEFTWSGAFALVDDLYNHFERPL